MQTEAHRHLSRQNEEVAGEGEGCGGFSQKSGLVNHQRVHASCINATVLYPKRIPCDKDRYEKCVVVLISLCARALILTWQCKYITLKNYKVKLQVNERSSIEFR